jgi:hypothetical protein
MSTQGTTVSAFKKKKQALTTDTANKKRYNLEIVNKLVVEFNEGLAKFNGDMRVAKQSYIAVAKILLRAKQTLRTSRPKGVPESEWDTFKKSVHLDKWYEMRMLRIANAADTLKNYQDKLPNVENSLFFIAKLLVSKNPSDKETGLKVLKDPNLSPMSTLKDVKDMAGVESKPPPLSKSIEFDVYQLDVKNQEAMEKVVLRFPKVKYTLKANYDLSKLSPSQHERFVAAVTKAYKTGAFVDLELSDADYNRVNAAAAHAANVAATAMLATITAGPSGVMEDDGGTIIGGEGDEGEGDDA